MPFALILFGILLVSTGARNRTGDLYKLVVSDFTGPQNFFYWLAAIGGIGAIGYYAPARNVSRLFLALIILSMLLADKGVFAQLQAAIEQLNAPAPPTEADVGAATPDRVNAAPSTSPTIGGSLSEAGTILSTIDHATSAPIGALPGTGAVHDFLQRFGLTVN